MSPLSIQLWIHGNYQASVGSGEAVPPCGVSVFDRGLQYGDGLFSTVRVENGVPQLWSYHQQRLAKGVQALGIPLDLAQLQATIQTLLDRLRQGGHTNGVLKLLISRGTGRRGYLPPEQPEPLLIGYWQDMTFQPATPIIVGLLDNRLGLVTPKLSGLKTLNRLEQIVLRQELAQHADWQEALVCDVLGYLREGVSSNLFYKLKGSERWYTPDSTLAGIEGVYRAWVLDEFQQKAIPFAVTQHRLLEPLSLFHVLENPATELIELDKIDSLFFCNALSGVVPVAQLASDNGRRELNLSPVNALIRQIRQGA